MQLVRHDTIAAMRTIERAMFSKTMGFTRSNLLLARLLVARGETRRAADFLRAALQGATSSSNYFVTLTELHEALAQAYASLGMTDSARVHWHWVSLALARADSGARPRYLAAMNHLTARRVADSDSSSRKGSSVTPAGAPRAKR
jgi:lipopolysaccharide biosynthesis regulator YciM